MSTLWQDFRFAIRSLGRSPGFVVIAVVTLGLGIGANTATFSFINEIFLPADYRELKSERDGYGEIAAYGRAEMSLAEPGRPAELAAGVRASASISYAMPFFGLAEPCKYLVAGRKPPQPGQEPAAVINGVSPHYFETVGTRLLSGRSFDERDTLASPKVFVINQAMAQGLFGGESPLGRRIAQGEIVGVASDIQAHGLLCSWIARDARRCEGSDVRPGAAPDLLLAGGRGWPRSSGVAAAGTYTGLFDPGPHLFS